jgi:predicted RecB family nuclease
MNTNNSITAQVFAAFLKCPTKAHLLAVGEPSPGTYITDIEARLSSMYKAVARSRLRVGTQLAEPLDFSQLGRISHYANVTHNVDCETAVYDFTQKQHRPPARQSPESSPSGSLVPVLFLPWDKPNLSDSLLMCFGALAVSQATGVLSDIGAMICGEGYRHRTVKIGNHVARTHQIIDAIAASYQDRKPPPLVLNRHCAVCDFQPRCRNLAMKRDDFSLLTAMTAKERAKCNAKGISTITQLSYGYRPRRRKRTRPDAEHSGKSARRTATILKNDHKLKALSIKKNQIHVVGGPSLKFAGVPIFLDVEGMSDRDFYYLIGLSYECDGRRVERSFWADGLDGERVIWENSLREIMAIGNAQIVSYGAYEIRFLRKMRERYVTAPDEIAFVDRLIETSVNLIGCIYGKIYFPTFSNSLKEVGRYLGFEWTFPRASGAAAPLLRRTWELGADDGLKPELIGYNMDDCRAAVTVAEALARICGDGALGLDAVDVGSLEVGFQRTFGKFNSALPEFARINDAAYWDYQRSKVYARTDKTIRRMVQKSQGNRKCLTVEKEVTIGERPNMCAKCHATRIGTHHSRSQVVYDLKFTRRGVKRWTVRYSFSVYRCRECGAFVPVYSRRSRYGLNLRAFMVYLMIELRLSNQKAVEHLSLLFNLPLNRHEAHRI